MPTHPQEGLNKLYFALHPNIIPFFDPTTGVPQDLMHVELEGTVRYELAWLFYSLIVRHEIFTLSQLNAAIVAFNWPMGHRVPQMDKRILKGKAGSKTPLEGSTIASSASQTLHLALNRCGSVQRCRCPLHPAHFELRIPMRAAISVSPCFGTCWATPPGFHAGSAG